VSRGAECVRGLDLTPFQRQSTSLSATSDRRQALAQIGVAVAGFAGLPSLAVADGAVSAATIERARNTYGDRIAALKGAVAAGDFDAIVEEKNAFILYNSGTYPGVKNKDKKAAAVADTNAIFKAIRSKDKAGLKAAYDSYVATNNIKPLPTVDVQTGQGYSSDYDYRVKTKAAAVYVR